MQLLLPPSEAKNPGGRGRAFGLRPPHPLLGEQRAAMIAALQQLVVADPAVAATALVLPPNVAAAALAANAEVLASPTVPALRRYAGIVYDGLGFDALPADAQRLALRRVHVFSGLFGVVRGDEAVPDYRVPAKAALPGVGIAGTAWRPVLDEAMPALLGRGLVVDLRSSDYQAMWRPSSALAARVLTVRVLSPLPAGGLGVVSYPSKYAKGRLAAALLGAEAAGARLGDIEEVAAVWRAATGHVAQVQGPTSLVIHHPAKVVGTGL